MKTITEIREITKSHQITVSQALENIECSANAGQSACLFPNLSEDAFNELFRCGFRLSKFTDSMGMDVIRVEW